MFNISCRANCIRRATLAVIVSLVLAVTTWASAPAVMVKDLNPQPYQGRFTIDGNLVNVNGTLFFTAWDEINGTELWKSDGTPAGTMLVKDISPGVQKPYPLPAWLTNVNGILFFSVGDGSAGQELSKSDGTLGGTVLVKDIVPGPLGSWPTALTNVNGTLFFSADDENAGQDLWKSDGTTTGTVIVKRLPTRESIDFRPVLQCTGDSCCRRSSVCPAGRECIAYQHRMRCRAVRG
jgi:ELWxxDGT repeat protein